MYNYLVYLKFNGKNYHGWQFQKNSVSIEEKVKFAVSAINEFPTTVYGCSRTDGGVHANMYCFNFHSPKFFESFKLVRAINAYLPSDIAAYDCKIVSEEFHARFDAVGKEYLYKVYNHKLRDPFTEDFMFRYCFSQLDVERLNKCCKSFIGTHDFKAFCSTKCNVSSTVRTIYEFNVERVGDVVTFRVVGDGFLYNMVRIMVGTLIRISEGRIGEDDIGSILSSGDRTMAGITVPPNGLYLNRVIYDKNDL